MAQELEIKARIISRDTIKSKLQNLGAKFGAEKSEHDKVFKLPHHEDGIPKMRVRTVNNTKHILTYKKKIGKGLNKLEHETEVSNLEETVNMILALHYIPDVEIKKSRIKGTYNSWELCLDSVENLGDFLEIECLNPKNTDEEMREMENFLYDLGIEKKDIVTEGYDLLIEKVNHART